MKHLLLITSFVLFGSSLIASETNNNDNNGNERLKSSNNSEAVILEPRQLSLAHLIKENPLAALGTAFVLGSLVPAKTKFHVFMGGTIGAVIVLKATDKNISDAIDRSFSRVTETFNKTKEAIAEKWNDFLAPKKD